MNEILINLSLVLFIIVMIFILLNFYLTSYKKKNDNNTESYITKNEHLNDNKQVYNADKVVNESLDDNNHSDEVASYKKNIINNLINSINNKQKEFFNSL